MESSKLDPFINYRFRVELDGMEMMGFSKVSELSNETDVETYKEGGINGREHKLPNGSTYSNITLEKGLSLDNTLYEWREDVLKGDMTKALKSGSIKVYTKGQVTSIWYFHGAWPSKLNVSGFDATGSGDVLVESVELVIERFERSESKN